MRQKRLVKVQQLKQELEKSTDAQPKVNTMNRFAQALRKKLFSMDAGEKHVDDNSELLKRLKEWDDHKNDYQLLQFQRKAAQAGLAELDEN